MASWKRTYWAVWVANFITACGMMSFLPFFPSHLARLGLSDRAEIAAWSGVIYGAAPLAAGLMAPLWGAFGDRFGRRFMVVRAMGAITVFVGAMAFARTPLELLLLRLAQGVFSGFVAPSVTLVSVIAPMGKQGQVAGSLQTAVALGAVIGPALGGLLGPAIGLDALFLSVAGASALGALCVLVFAEESAGQRQQRPLRTSFRGLARGTLRDLASVWSNPRMRGALMLIFVLQFGLGATNPLLELFVGDLSGASGAEAARITGALFSVMALVNIVALPLWGRFGDRSGHARLLDLCALSCALTLALHGLAPWLWLVFVARALLGGAVAGISPLAFGLAAAEIAVERRGEAFGAVFSARTLALSISSMAGGYLSRYIGIRGLFLCGGALVLLALFELRRRASAQAQLPKADSARGE